MGKYSFISLLLLSLNLVGAQSLKAQNQNAFETQIALPKDSGYVNIAEGGKMYWESYGDGYPLVLVHGHTLDRRMWREQIPVFSKKFKVIVPDMRGYGRSTKQGEGMKVTHMDDLITLIDSLHIKKAHFVGLSMGGFIVSDLVALHPERLKTCILASGNLRSVKGPSEPMDSTETAESTENILHVLAEGVDKWKEDWIEKLVKGGGSNAENIRTELSKMIYDWDAWQITHHELRLYYAREALPVLKETCPQVPTLFLSGENEHKRRSSIMNYFPNSEFSVLPDCGHMSNMEQPELFNKTVLDFIEKNKHIIVE